MSNYRRIYLSGGTYFFTVVTHDRRPILCSENSIQRLRSAFHYAKTNYPFNIDALVVLPDHIHCIWQLPENDFDFSKRWNIIKRYFSLGFQSNVNERREKNIWQRRFWEHAIRSEYDLHRCLDYIYYNPVKHGYTNKPFDWNYSTFKRDVKNGFYQKDWGSREEPKGVRGLDFE